jgi:hypothetical protein
MKLHKPSFFIGIWISYLASLCFFGYITVKDFVSKDSLKDKIVFIDGKRYKVERQ